MSKVRLSVTYYLNFSLDIEKISDKISQIEKISRKTQMEVRKYSDNLVLDA